MNPEPPDPFGVTGLLMAFTWSGLVWAVAAMLLFLFEEADEKAWWAAHRRRLPKGRNDSGDSGPDGPDGRSAATI